MVGFIIILCPMILSQCRVICEVALLSIQEPKMESIISKVILLNPPFKFYKLTAPIDSILQEIIVYYLFP